MFEMRGLLLIQRGYMVALTSQGTFTQCLGTGCSSYQFPLSRALAVWICWIRSRVMERDPLRSVSPNYTVGTFH